MRPRDWEHPRLSRRAWVLLLVAFALIVFAFQSSSRIPRGSGAAILALIALLVATESVTQGGVWCDTSTSDWDPAPLRIESG
ncbi:MAG: hypothetical protein ACE5HJ_07470 [Thermoplasmata archaeon]